ncbi:type II toxin-antitoxin system RelE/ParE family toxin [Dyadobacter sp. CY345]|nr:type II toxin-antitoxin system RelE/ParE family toxin [Dyadobacter sp. CY345]
MLDTAETVEELDIPGYRLHKLTGNLKDFHSLKVNANYRIIFRFFEGNSYDIDFIDYH